MQIVSTREKNLDEWFDSSYYHSLYQHRDSEEAFRFINYLLTELQPPKDSKMLDLGCGTGRHSIHLANYEFDVTGIDLSLNNILKAQEHSSNKLRFGQGDMRLPFGKEEYDYVFSFFTSFGYFATEENSVVAKNITDSLKHGGMLIIDYLNAITTIKKLVPFEVVKREGLHFFIKRWIDEGFVHKQIAVSDAGEKTEVLFTERVRLFQLKDLVGLFTSQGLALVNAYGDYALNEYHSERSERMILAFKK